VRFTFGPVLPHTVVSNSLTRFRWYHRTVKSQNGIPRGHKITSQMHTRTVDIIRILHS